MRFTIRDVLWLTLVVGLAVGWWVDRGQLARRLDWVEMGTADEPAPAAQP